MNDAPIATPGYWMYETSGVLWPAVDAFILGEPMTREHIAAMRAYLRQWIMAPRFLGSEVEALRRRVDGLTTRDAIDQWLDDAIDAGVDPL